VSFCLPAEPLASGETVWWVFDVTNVTDRSIDLTFSSGQIGDVVLSQDGAEKYRWSEGKAFTEAIRVDTIEPGRRCPTSLTISFGSLQETTISSPQ